MDGWMNGWMNEWMDGWIDNRTDLVINSAILQLLYVISNDTSEINTISRLIA